MLIEFQTSAANFLYQFREKLKSTSTPFKDELTDSAGGTQIVNRVTIGNETQMRSDTIATFPIWQPSLIAPMLLPGKQVQIVQPVTIELVYLDDLVAKGDVPAPVVPVPIWVVFNVSLAVISSAANLSISYSSVEGLLPPKTLSDLDARLKAAIKPQVSPVDLSALQNVISGLSVVNAAISRHPGTFHLAESVALRIELGSADSGTQEWQRFLNGNYDILLDTPGMRPDGVPAAPAERWAVFLDNTILERYLQISLESSFGPGKKVQLRSGIDVQWSNPGGQARLDASFKAIAIDVCDLGPLGKYDIRVDVQIPVLLSVPSDNVLRQNLKINKWKNDLDTAACIAGVGLFWPIVGWDMMSKNKVQWWQFELLLVLPPLAFIAALVKANDKHIDPPDSTMTQLSDDEFQRDQPFSKKPPSPSNPLVLLNYRGLSSGLVLTGRQLQFPDTCAPFLESDHCGFQLKPPRIPCSSVAGATQDELQQKFTRDVYAAASAIVNNIGEPGCPGLPQIVPLQKWDGRFLDDGLAKALGIQIVEDDYTDGIGLRFDCPLPPDSYYADPLPVQYLLKTNGGARVFTYTLSKPYDEEIEKLAIAGAVAAINHCKQLVDPWWAFFHRYNPQWSVDPPVFRSPGDQRLWVMAFLGLGQGDSIAVRLGDRLVQTARANSRGRSIVTVLHNANSPERLTLEFRSNSHERQAGMGRMLMSQVALSQLAVCGFSAPVQRLEVAGPRHGRMLYAIHGDGYSVVDLSVPSAPSILMQRRGRQFHGAVLNGDSPLVFSGEKPVVAETLSARPPSSSCEDHPQTICALAINDQFYAVRRHEVDVFDRALCHVRRIPLDRPATHAVVTGGYLVVAGSSRVSVLDPDDAQALRHFEVGPVESLETADLSGGTGETILVRSGARTALYQLPGPLERSQRLELIAEYDETPWFGGALQFDTYLGTISDRVVTISSIVGRVTPCHPA